MRCVGCKSDAGQAEREESFLKMTFVHFLIVKGLGEKESSFIETVVDPSILKQLSGILLAKRKANKPARAKRSIKVLIYSMLPYIHFFTFFQLNKLQCLLKHKKPP